MEYNCGLLLSTPGGDITFDVITGDAYSLDPTQCAGLDMVPLRTTIDDAPVTDGGIVHPFYQSPRHITLTGSLIVRSASDDAGFVTARNALEDALNAALLSIQSADGTLTWTRTGDVERGLAAVRCDITATYAGGMQKTYIFGLVAADPTIAIID